MKCDIVHYDTSDYVSDNVYGMPLKNKKIPGKLKDENNGDCMLEFVGLRAKMYSYRVNHMKNPIKKKAKGVKKYVLDNKITFDDYLKCIESNSEVTNSQNTIRSKKHTVFTIKQTKILLSPFDDKRKIMANGIDTMPHGHYSLENQ